MARCDLPGTTLHPSIQLDDAFGPVGCKESEYNQGDGNANIILFRDTSWPYDGASHVLALTTVSFGVKSGQIVDVDIEVNSTVHLGVNEDPEGNYDLQSILTHEVGHFLGLAHSAIHRPPCGPNTPREALRSAISPPMTWRRSARSIRRFLRERGQPPCVISRRTKGSRPNAVFLRPTGVAAR